tara:strand:+ start:5342 stop:6616 length:1275 start_codon:yes stop_codon:yes gene_type:complete
VAKQVSDIAKGKTNPISYEITQSSLSIRIFSRLAAAFSSTNFRNLWLGAFISAIGTWMQRFAQQWLILTLTGSAFYLGLDTFVGELPLLLFTLIGGVIADRYDRRHLLMASQTLQMICALTLTSLVILDLVEIKYILALSFMTGVAQAFGGPAFQSLIPTLVPRAIVPNAIALNSIQFNLAQTLGPLIGGIVLASLGMVACFGLNGASFILVIIVLGFMKLPRPPFNGRKRMITELKHGLSYVHQQRVLLWLTVIALSTTTFGIPLRSFLPVFADNATHLSWMMTSLGAGAVTGALIIAWLGTFENMGRTLLLVLMIFGGLVTTFTLLPFSIFSYLILYLAGASLLVVFSLMSSLVQLAAPNELRGRVISIYLMAQRGGMPLGGLLSGYLITLTSAQTVISVNGVILIVVAIYALTNVSSLKNI